MSKKATFTMSSIPNDVCESYNRLAEAVYEFYNSLGRTHQQEFVIEFDRLFRRLDDLDETLENRFKQIKESIR